MSAPATFEHFERELNRLVEQFGKHLAPEGMAGFVLANGGMAPNQSGEGDIRRALIEAVLVDCMVGLPGQLFYSTQIPVCLWFLANSKPPTPNAVSGVKVTLPVKCGKRLKQVRFP